MIKKNISSILNKVEMKFSALFRKSWRKPAILGVILIMFYALPDFISSLDKHNLYNQLLNIATIAALTWLLIQGVKTLGNVIIRKNSLRPYGSLDTQQIDTKIEISIKIIIKSLVGIGTVLALMTFPQIHKIGISVLASAGAVSVILGVAAQKILGKVMTGIQIAFTQPIKLGDEIFIEGEVGTVEKITLTYIILITSDRRHIIIPINYFSEKIYQNWSISSSERWGVVHIELDYNTPLKDIRHALDSILETTDLWDKKYKQVQISKTESRTIELRILASTSTSSDAQNLQYYMREKLIEFIQNNHPDYLPKIRLNLDSKDKNTINFS